MYAKTTVMKCCDATGMLAGVSIRICIRFIQMQAVVASFKHPTHRFETMKSG